MHRDSARRDISLAEAHRDAAIATVHQLDKEQAGALQILEDYDRPLQRRRHAPEIADARRRLERVGWQLRGTQEAIAAAEARIAEEEQVRHAAQTTLNQRPHLESKLREIETVVGDDLHVRMRIARLERPAIAVERLGERPAPGPGAVAWDKAAGRLVQFDAAFSKDRDGRRHDEEMLRSLRHDLRRNVEYSVTEYLDLDLDRGRRRGREGPALSR